MMAMPKAFGRACLGVLLIAGSQGAWSQEGIEATTVSGEKVHLFANGRWEYVNPQKAVEQRQAIEADFARERSSQGGFLGFGRRLHEGDEGYNRGSLNPKLR